MVLEKIKKKLKWYCFGKLMLKFNKVNWKIYELINHKKKLLILIKN